MPERPHYYCSGCGAYFIGEADTTACPACAGTDIEKLEPIGVCAACEAPVYNENAERCAECAYRFGSNRKLEREYHRHPLEKGGRR